MKRPALIILAAGASKRFGQHNKLLADLEGEPLLARTLSVYPADLFSSRHLVVAESDAQSIKIGASLGFETVVNQRAQDGMGTSIAVGASKVAATSDLMIALGDMPFIQPTTIARLLDGFAALKAPVILAPDYLGVVGHPKLFSSQFLPALSCLSGDQGARRLFAGSEHCLQRVAVQDDGVVRDVDIREDLQSRG